MRASVLVALALVATIGARPTAAEEPTLEVTTSNAAVSVGDHVAVRVAARGSESLLWGGIDLALEPDGPWTVIAEPREVAGARPPIWDLTLAALAVGEIELPAISATVRDSDNTTRRVAATVLPTVTVASVLPAEGEVEPAPLRPPIGVSGFPWEWVLPAAVPLSLIVAALAFVVRRHSYAGPGGAAGLPPLDELLALASELERRVGRDPSTAICDRVAGGLRRYLERRTSEPAQEMTSFELRILAREADWPDSMQRDMRTVMDLTDGVRFGRRPATDDQLQEAIGSATVCARALEHHLAAVEEAASEVEAGG